jgi:hypothetical protein
MKWIFIIILILAATIALAKMDLSIKLGLELYEGMGPGGSQAFVDSDGKYFLDSEGKYLLGATP